MNGYILESKKILESEIWKKPPLYFKVWHYLLLKAQFTDVGNLKRGEFFTSINDIAEACSYYVGYRKVTPSRKEIWSILEFLRNPCEEDNETDSKGTMIETTKVTHGIIVNICNYNKYQDPKSYEGKSEGNDEILAEEQRNGQQGNNINNEFNEYKNIKNTPTVYEKAPTKSDAETVVDIYNEECVSLPKVKVLSAERVKKVEARLKNHSMDELRLAFQKVEASDFCTGRKGNRDSQWCNFDWLMKSETNLLKVLEGNYDNKPNATQKAIRDLGGMNMTQEEYEDMERRFG